MGNYIRSVKEKSAWEYFKQGNSFLNRGDMQAGLNKFIMAAILFKDSGNNKKYKEVREIITQLERKSFESCDRLA